MKKILSVFLLSGALSLSAVVEAQLPDFTGMVTSEGPAVVNINTTQTVRERQVDPFAEFFGSNPFFGESPFGSPRTREYQSRSLGSGFVISADGYIMTNAHVVAKADEITVTMTDKREYKAKLIGADARTDVALLKVEGNNLPVVRMGNPANLKVGEWVVAIGSPYGFNNSVSAGIVSAKERQLPQEDFVPFIQTDVAVNPGNSGGPLFNMQGEVVGINSQIYSQSGGFQGISFAIPIDVANKIANELKTQGRVARGQLGIYLQELTKELASSFGLPDANGALIAQVAKGSAAEKGGMVSGDIVLKIDNNTINKASDLIRVVGNIKPGTQAKIQVWRNKTIKNLTVSVGETKEESAAFQDREPKNKQSEKIDNKAGMLFQNLTVQDMKQLNQMGFAFGLVVVDPGTAGRSNEIRRGDVVVGINGTSLKNGQQILDVLNNAKKGEILAFQIIRQGGILFVAVPMSGK